MKHLYMIFCVAVFTAVCGIAVAEDMDVKALQAKLAAQEARLNDLQAKMYAANCDEGTVADGLTSLRKNAVVTIGGTVNTRYFYRSGSIKSTNLYYLDATGTLYYPADGTMRKIADAKGGDLFIADAKLEGKIDVNDYFDAYFKFDLQSSDDGLSDNAEQYWVRWKNICNSGFGVIVGRDSLKYGMAPTVGVLDSWSGSSNGNGYGGMFDAAFDQNAIFPGWGQHTGLYNYAGEGMFSHNSMTPYHSTWDHSRVTQINPYWENCDGSFKAEVSFIQSIDSGSGRFERANNGRTAKLRTENYGVGSMTGRLTWKPVEGLTLIASAMNLYNNRMGGDLEEKNNFAASFGFEYTPCFFDKLTLWGYYQHGWDEGWQKDYDTDLVNAGIKFDFTDQFYMFVQGDYLYGKDKKSDERPYGNPLGANMGYDYNKAKGWAGYVGFGYVLPYGVNFEAGYRHEKIDYKGKTGGKHTKYKGDTVYAHLGFNF